MSNAAQVAPSTQFKTLVTGTYKDRRGRAFAFEGPTLISNGRLQYTFNGLDTSFAAQIVTGPAVGHTDIGTREIAASLPDTHTYGVVTDVIPNGASVFGSWRQNSIIGLRQLGDQLSAALFTDRNGDAAVPVDTTLLELTPAQ